MDARLTQIALSQRAAASQAVAGALAPKGATRSSASASTAGATGTTATSSADASAAITSSDFLTLLVSELKNQDPTQPTDPNQYITQLAQVNSLEQLISINSGIQTLDSSVPATGGSSGGTTSGTAGGTTGATLGAASPDNLQPATAPAAVSQIHKQVPGAAA